MDKKSGAPTAPASDPAAAKLKEKMPKSSKSKNNTSSGTANMPGAGSDPSDSIPLPPPVPRPVGSASFQKAYIDGTSRPGKFNMASSEEKKGIFVFPKTTTPLVRVRSTIRFRSMVFSVFKLCYPPLSRILSVFFSKCAFANGVYFSVTEDEMDYFEVTINRFPKSGSVI
jgi:hypothetical protein